MSKDKIDLERFGQVEEAPENGHRFDAVVTLGVHLPGAGTVGLLKYLKKQQTMIDEQGRALRQARDELDELNEKLAATDIALKVLLDKREGERRALEERIVCNINELIRPHLSKLFDTHLNQRQRALLHSIASGLDDILSPLSRRFIIESSRLSPMEMKVAGLIRQGNTTKEIAELLGVAASTVDFHRLNIRKKLNIKSRHVNLQTYLKSLA